jgi:hypothetical protein
MYTIILYKRPDVSTPFFQPNSETWQNPDLLNFYQSIKDNGTLVSDTIEITEDQLIMKKTMVWKDFERWYEYVNDFVSNFPTYAENREIFHQEHNSQYLVKTFFDDEVELSSLGNINASVTIHNNNGVISSSYVINEL